MRVAIALLLIAGGLALGAFGGIGLLFVLSGQPPDAGALGFTGGCVIVGAGLFVSGVVGLLRRSRH